MEEIKIGSYVRTKEGIIDKVDTFNINTNIYHCENGLCIDKENKIAVALKDIKHSKNIIDLIECGDYVNGREVKRLKGEVNLSDVNNEEDFCYTDYSDEYGEWYGLKKDEIKTILTKEQYEQNSYKV